jgi:small nuclear ribonucleoprotein (snRNP)-like protein
MAIGRRVAMIFALVTSLVLAPVLAMAQGSPSNDWSSLRNLAIDSKLSVKLKTGKTVEGRFKSVSDSSLTLTSKNAPLELKRDDISTVHQLVKKSATKATLIGAGLGAGAGAGIGAIASASDDSNFDKFDQAAIAGLAVAGAVVGAVAGYFIGRGSPRKVLLFENK